MASKLKFLVLHCTDTPEGREVTAAMIRDWHTSAPPRGRGWKQVGYSDMIHLNGHLENLVPYNDDELVDAWEITNGVAGINGVARHVVLVGGKDRDMRFAKDTRTKEQRLTLTNYVKMQVAMHPDILVSGHYQFDPNKPYCPGWNVPEWLMAVGFNPKNIYQP
jgi:N-acetylmuramoyl-L-alanine amidase